MLGQGSVPGVNVITRWEDPDVIVPNYVSVATGALPL